MIKIILGLVCVVGGVWLIIWTYRNPNEMDFQKGEGVNAPDYKSYMIGLGLIAGGIILIKENLT